MKKLFALGAAALVAGFVTTARADNPKKSASVKATIAAFSDITTFEVYDMNNVKIIDGSGIEFVNPSNAIAWNAKGNRYIKLAITNKHPKWELKTYTDNFTYDPVNPLANLPSTTTWGYQYGGLKGPEYNGKGQMAGLGWLVVRDTNVVQFQGPDAGDPSATQVVNGSTVPVNDWLFVKDRSDRNIPEPNETPDTDQSFAGSKGYTNIAFGNPLLTRVVRPTAGAANQFSDPLSAPEAPFYYFLGANFNELVPGSYNATVNFELINL